MAITIDWITKTIKVPQADLTLVTGTLYELNTETFRNELNALMASEEGMPFEDPIRHATEVTVAGTTFARSIEIINGYSVEFIPDAQYTVRLAGSNNNLFDVENGILVQNQVQVIAQNSAGLIRVDIGTTPTQQQLRDAQTLAPSPGTPDAGSIDALLANLASGQSTLLTNQAGDAVKIELIRALLQNKSITDQADGKIKVYNDAGTAVLYEALIYEDAAAVQAYQGRGIERRERLQ